MEQAEQVKLFTVVSILQGRKMSLREIKEFSEAFIAIQLSRGKARIQILVLKH